MLASGLAIGIAVLNCFIARQHFQSFPLRSRNACRYDFCSDSLPAGLLWCVDRGSLQRIASQSAPGHESRDGGAFRVSKHPPSVRSGGGKDGRCMGRRTGQEYCAGVIFPTDFAGLSEDSPSRLFVYRRAISEK